ncbi:hypothetical protein KIH32_01185 [Pseudomonas fluorescens]|uniref:hypothetical protein n=1 Tax=Pseudomonas fluorescens TaxID=294 RepID=UPI001BDB1B51|nr:hypothetical protein [Pseudomonas fluorescens]MBT0622503.1 hypothetical protein [Pseudomonas fluorescens]
MNWNSSDYTNLPFHVAEEIGKYGFDAVYTMFKTEARSADDLKRSDALSYLAAAIDTDLVRDAASKLAPISANRTAKIAACDAAFAKLTSSVESINYKALDFFELLEEKYNPLVVKLNLPIRPFYVSKQAAELIDEKIAEFSDRLEKVSLTPNDTELDILYLNIVSYFTEELTPLLEKQIELYLHFASFDALANSEQQNDRYGGYKHMRVAPGKMYMLIEKGQLYRDATKKMGQIKKNIQAFKSADSARLEAIKQYKEAKLKIEEVVPNRLGNFIDEYWKLTVFSEISVNGDVD